VVECGGSGAISTDTLHVPARVLVSQAATGLNAGSDPDLEPGSADLCTAGSDSRSPEWRRRVYKSLAVRSNRPSAFHHHWARRLKGRSRLTPIGWLQTRARRAAAARASGLGRPHPRCRITFHQVSVSQTLNAAARDYVRRRHRARPVDGRSSRLIMRRARTS
jgi:hypothetical protein